MELSRGIVLGRTVNGHFVIDETSFHALMNLGRIMGDEPYNVIEVVSLHPVRKRGAIDGFTAWQAEKLFGVPMSEFPDPE